MRFGILYKPDERLHKRQLQNKVRLIILLYYLPMEMTKKEKKKSEYLVPDLPEIDYESTEDRAILR